MIIDVKNLPVVSIPNLNGGVGEIKAQMFSDANGKVMTSLIPAGCSIGLHKHITSSEYNYILMGSGKAICDGKEERLTAGIWHYCPVGSEHSIINDSNADMMLLTVVAEK